MFVYRSICGRCGNRSHIRASLSEWGTTGSELAQSDLKALDCLVSVLIDSDAVNTTLTREPYDMIDRDQLVMKSSTFVRDREAGESAEETRT